MNITKVLAAGLAGSLILTATHQLLKTFYDDAPRMDLLGEEALVKLMNKVGINVPEEEKLYNITLAADIAMNTLFYSAAAYTVSSCSKGTVLGLAAGLGAVYLPAKLGLNAAYSNRTKQTKMLTIALYTLGGMVAGKMMDKLDHY